jgi:hypothetical protein
VPVAPTEDSSITCLSGTPASSDADDDAVHGRRFMKKGRRRGTARVMLLVDVVSTWAHLLDLL